MDSERAPAAARSRASATHRRGPRPRTARPPARPTRRTWGATQTPRAARRCTLSACASSSRRTACASLHCRASSSELCLGSSMATMRRKSRSSSAAATPSMRLHESLRVSRESRDGVFMRLLRRRDAVVMITRESTRRAREPHRAATAGRRLGRLARRRRRCGVRGDVV